MEPTPTPTESTPTPTPSDTATATPTATTEPAPSVVTLDPAQFGALGFVLLLAVLLLAASVVSQVRRR